MLEKGVNPLTPCLQKDTNSGFFSDGTVDHIFGLVYIKDDSDFANKSYPCTTF